MKIGIVGAGWVGSSVAVSTLHSGVATELLISDANKELAEGEAMDLAHGAAFYPAASVRRVGVEEMVGADAVVISAGRGGRPDQTRLDLLHDNATIVRDIAARLGQMSGILIIVTNPVDIMTQVAAEASGLPHSRVMGTGTMLDTARLRQVLGRKLRLDPRSIHAQVVGEHGDSEVVLWSGAQIGGVPLRRWVGWTNETEEAMAREVRRAAYEIIRRKGATNHAIGLATAALLRWALRGERRVLTVSRVQDGAMGLRDCALSLPAIIDSGGAVEVIEPEMDSTERESLMKSAEIISNARRALA